jgi:hypothetical protein
LGVPKGPTFSLAPFSHGIIVCNKKHINQCVE